MGESLGLKTIFEHQTGENPTTYEPIYTAIAQVANIQPPQLARDVADIDDLAPTDDIKKKLPGLIDVGEVTMTLNFDPDIAGHTALRDAFYAKTSNKYRIKFPSGNGWTFTAYVTGWAPQELSASDVIQVEVTFSVTAKPIFGVIL